MIELISALIGGGLGVVVVALWQATEARLGGGDFWSAYRRIAGNLLTGAEQEQFLQQYAELMRRLGGYLAKTACRVAIAIAPVIVCLALLGPLAARRAARTADRLEVYPPQAVQLQVAHASYSTGPEGTVELPGGVFRTGNSSAPLRLTTNDRAVEAPDFQGAIAFCESEWRGLGLQLIGLEVHHAPQGPRLLIVRATDGERNFCWPFLSDVEFSFWAGMLVTSLAAAVVGKARRQ